MLAWGSTRLRGHPGTLLRSAQTRATAITVKTWFYVSKKHTRFTEHINTEEALRILTRREEVKAGVAHVL